MTAGRPAEGAGAWIAIFAPVIGPKTLILESRFSFKISNSHVGMESRTQSLVSDVSDMEWRVAYLQDREDGQDIPIPTRIFIVLLVDDMFGSTTVFGVGGIISGGPQEAGWPRFVHGTAPLIYRSAHPKLDGLMFSQFGSRPPVNRACLNGSKGSSHLLSHRHQVGSAIVRCFGTYC